jgi:hypothetical protein
MLTSEYFVSLYACFMTPRHADVKAAYVLANFNSCTPIKVFSCKIKHLTAEIRKSSTFWDTILEDTFMARGSVVG